ncbi:restriction endonuclease subunit S [uncultured Alloprevotella sp.]|uniref:restriction endonuclease subunit S n=1 Tax=uncultured Alloprevotella sp. TaxID=1283315 RepID=UPI002610D3A8|nr:restriction endonuclease subunit S [uncultured Alloprevotella sp.]
MKVKIGDCIECNPTVKLVKGNKYPLIDIDKITVGRKLVTHKASIIYDKQSGCKFQNGDTLMARITPCLENGKIAMASIPDKGIGSTELFVFRGKKGITDNDFVYYFLKQDYIRDLATNSMTGASGRQRADLKFIKKIAFKLPPLPLQQKIASILSAYDTLIENNTRRIRLLEQMAENLYKEWFVRFRFPGHENVEMVNGLPKGWIKEELSNIADVCMGSSPKSEYYNDEKRGLPFHQGVGSFGERFVLDNTYSTSYSQIAEPMSILFSVRAPVGRLNYTRNRIVIGRGVAAINHKEGMQSLLFYTLKAKFFKEDIVGNGAIFASITKKELLNLKLVVPEKSLSMLFNKKISNLDREIDLLYIQNTLLTRQRDLLLPRLMSGKLEVKP